MNAGFKAMWSSSREAAPARALARYSVVVFFLIFNFAFYIQPALAQTCPVSDPSGAVVCPGTTRWCGGTCQTPPASCAGEYVINCGSCACACPSGETDCGGNVCEASDGTCATANRTTTSVCTAPDTCGLCSGGFTDCDGGAGFDCRSTASAACAAPRSYNPCTGVCTDPYVLVSPSSVQTGFINLSSYIKTGGSLDIRGGASGAPGTFGDLYMGSTNAIRIDADSSTASFNIGNWGASSQGLAMNIFGQLTLDSSLTPQQAILRINQGHADGIRRWTGLRLDRSGAERWFLGMDGTTDNLIFRRGSSTNDLILDTSGNVRVNGGQLQLANLATAPAAPANPPLTGALYYSTAAGDTGVRVYNGTAWAAIGGAGGLSTTAPATLGRLTKFIGSPLTLTDSLISETGSTITVGTAAAPASITATGCFGPVFVGVTGTPVDGARGGYTAVHSACASAYPSAGVTPAAHACSTAEILESVQCGVPTSLVFTQSGFAWINNGPPAFTAPANDCQGWRNADATTFGTMWEFGATGGQGHLTGCNTTRVFSCCR